MAAGVVYLTVDSTLYALEASTGQEIWRSPEELSVDTAPAVAGSVVYFGAGREGLVALNAVTGEEQWRFKDEGSVTAAPIVEGDIIYAAGDDGFLFAVGAATGRELRAFPTGRAALSTPAAADGFVYVVGSDSDDPSESQNVAQLIKFDASTGQEVWRFSAEGTYLSPPSIADGVISMVGNQPGWVGNSLLYAIDSASGKARWEKNPGLEQNLGNFTNAYFVSEPAIVGDAVYFVVSYGGAYSYLSVINAATGQECWRLNTLLNEAPPTVADGAVYLTGDPDLFAVDAGTGEELWRLRAMDATDDTRNIPGSWRGPTVVGGVVYVVRADRYGDYRYLVALAEES